ncbi:MAG: peptidase M14 [Gammaproteobacteria bacterium]|nr:MAG: peptidase M14 [Gammaproteobacteria bacterium]
MLTITDRIPDGLLEASARDLHRILPGPTLIHLPGRRPEPLFVSILLHGNEDTGLLAMQNILHRYDTDGLPRALSLFIGNVAAAAQGLRRLEGQPDYNRVWPGGDHWMDSPEAAMMARVVDEMRPRHTFASIDIHNNTGLNPHYACVNRLDHRHLQLATLFGRTVVYFIRPTGVQSMAMGALCPATTLECGKPHQPHGIERATEFVDACLHLEHIPDHPVAPHDIDLFHTVAQVTIAEQTDFSFSRRDADLYLNEDLDHMNFREVPAGTVWGRVNRPGACPVARDEHGRDVTADYFELHPQAEDAEGTGLLVLRRSVMPSMLTLDERVVRQDCLCYLMERLSPGEPLL